MFADSEYKWGPISTESERERERRRGRGNLGRRAERFFSRALSQRKGKKEEGRSGRNVFGAQPGVVVVVLVVVGPRSECGCEVTHWIIQWMLGEDYFSTNPPAERAGPPTSDAAETPLPLAFQFPPFYYVGRNQRRFRSPCHRTTF